MTTPKVALHKAVKKVSERYLLTVNFSYEELSTITERGNK